ncbi:MAG: DUF488 domain-containing protein [Thermomicrobiales bacterium]|nr:DUF488 domain-containing protein [Thermomicrobiales bacterium]
MSEPTTLTVFTIGHSNASETKFLELLKDNGIELVIDVRTVPYSRFAPQFNREKLKALLGGSRIGYVFMGDTMGGRPSKAELYKNWKPDVEPDGHDGEPRPIGDPAVSRGPWLQAGSNSAEYFAAEESNALMCSEGEARPAERADFLKLVDYPKVACQPEFQASIEEVMDLAAKQQTALMCSEEDPHRCHRHHLIAKALIKRRVAVRHIRHSGVVADFVDQMSLFSTSAEKP